MYVCELKMLSMDLRMEHKKIHCVDNDVYYCHYCYYYYYISFPVVNALLSSLLPLFCFLEHSTMTLSSPAHALPFSSYLTLF